MKKAIILIFLLFLIAELTFAHDGEIHKYIVFRAYQLLEKRYIEAGGNPQNLQEMRSKVLNNDGTQCNENNDPNHPIIRGAFREDVTDPIYGYLPILLTQTHFWKADDGDSQQNFGSIDNAFMKSKAYLFSYGNNYKWYEREYILYVILHREYLYYINSSLVDFYNTGLCKRIETNNIFGSFIDIVHPNSKNISYEILGRAAHLLADMSVPAHVHIDSHGDPEPYEKVYMKNNGKNLSTTTEDLINDDGFMPFLVNNYPDATIIKTLYYTMNQISSHFASDDKDGNNFLPEITNHILQKFDVWGQPLTHPASLIDQIDIAKKTYHFCIGATATLFYWFGLRTGMFQTQIKDLNFNCKILNPTLTIHADNSITLLPGFEFKGTDMLLTTEPKTSTGRRVISVTPEFAPNTTIVLDSLPQNLPIDTIFINN